MKLLSHLFWTLCLALCLSAAAAGQPAPAEQAEQEVWFEIYRVLVDDFPLPIREGEPVAPPLGRRNVEFRYGAVAADSVRFRFQMEGLDADWVDAEGRTFAYYRDLDAGSYTFRVEAQTVRGGWTRIQALPVFIAPYFYETGWFLLLVFGVVVALGAGLFWYQTRQVRAQSRRLGHLVAERTQALQQEKERAEDALATARQERAQAEAARAGAEAAHAEAQAAHAEAREALVTVEQQALQLLRVEHLKSQLFANLSHEFRTPLTLILDPLERVARGELGDFDDYARHSLDIARLNGLRLLRLVNQLLDLSKLEAGGMELQARRGDLVAFLQRAVDLFGAEAERLGIRLLFQSETDRLAVYFDPEKLEKIIFNLLSNALKAMPQGGKVLVSVRTSPALEDDGAPVHAGHAEIAIQDTGIGISGDKLPHIFDRFYQVKASTPSQGTGIGLSIVKELAELHRGEVLAESRLGFGSTFTVRLRLGDAHLGAHERVDDAPGEAMLPAPSPLSEESLLATRSLPDSPRPTSAAPPVAAEAADADGPPSPLVLIVDDHADLRETVRRHLDPHYRLVEASNGEEALSLARERRPDLVVSDILMPVMDGLELCQRIRDDEAIASTPVILITARGGDETRIAGFDTGADAYLTKPFIGEELLARAANLIRQRRTMRERFSQEVVLEPLDRPVRSADAAFLEGLYQIVEAHLDDAGFTVVQLAEEAAISPAQLKRKLRAIADQTPVELIRTYRLRRAEKLLRGQAGTVSEIAYAVGFNSVSYFAKVFRELTGKRPSDALADAAASRTAEAVTEPDSQS
ncbi:MAG: response regulator [Bacteroidota bacterium]